MFGGEVWDQGEGRSRPPRHGLIWGGGDDGWGWGWEASKYKNKPGSSNAAVDIFFNFEPRFFLLMAIADSPLLGWSASGLYLYDDSRSRPLVD